MFLHHRHAVHLLAGLTSASLFLAGCGSGERTQGPGPGEEPDTAPPLAPSSLATGKVTATGCWVSWAANSEPDLAGYRVYSVPGDGSTGEERVLLNTDGLVSSTRYGVHGTANSRMQVMVTAVDRSGNESAFSGGLNVVLRDDPLPADQTPDGENAGGQGPATGPGSPDAGPGKEPSDGQ